MTLHRSKGSLVRLTTLVVTALLAVAPAAGARSHPHHSKKTVPPHTQVVLVDSFDGPAHWLQRLANRSYMPTPRTTVKVWPLADLVGDTTATGGVDFWGTRPFLIALSDRPSRAELMHELGHVIDDGWMTADERQRFAYVTTLPADEWLMPDGSDGVSDNFAQAYALAAIYGAHPPDNLIRDWTGTWPYMWPEEFPIVEAVALRAASG